MYTPHLENEYVKLSLLDLSNYKHLATIAEEKDLVYYSPSAISPPEKLKEYVQLAVDAYYHKTAIPFLIYNKKKQVYAGCTRFGLINHKNKVLYIGWTWISKNFQGSGLNTQVKFLMLQYAFETLKFDKVAFKVDERNLRSRKAVEKIGGTFEGLLRKDTLMRDGFKRNTCYYGILKEEWPEIKKTIFKGF
ncbi:GNAT family N-acetyltransferase [Lacinutrix sp. C3R15]|uniref:GNAT family N-acetyltransferase n=1 Tax=Flavobacteriaceae TaxID=49546 RepID=UPI001C08E9B2|nr:MULTISPECIES: GNAT family protein [Flavobacteriaceae]MBU2940497.1 GNAT family N-acetyltransferase [Lacinutrix sp. C3R15]MDO6623817.1 GNAT family protein [Oceanihabitans sp. 1_MG-2023]